MRKATSKIEKITQKSYMDIWLRSSPRLRMLLDILEMATLIGVGLLFPSPRISSWWIKIIGIILTSTGIWLHKLSHSIHKQAHLPKEEIKALEETDVESSIKNVPCKIAVITLGKKGCLVKDKDEIYKLDGFEAKAIDTTGAGDLFAAGLLYGLSKEISLRDSSQLGNFYGSWIVTKSGVKIN